MAPPQLQCLNSVKQISRKIPCLRAGFSTSPIARAEDGRQRPESANALLDSLGNPASSQASRFGGGSPIRAPTKYQNVLPTRMSYQRPPPAANSKSNESILKLTQRHLYADRDQAKRNAANAKDGADAVADLKDSDRANKFTRMVTRRWKTGDVYAPHDLSDVEMMKWKRRSHPTHDAFDVLDMNPLDHYRNFSIMSEYMTDMGRIKHSKETGLRPVNQRRIARAIRRSIGIGLMPSVHKHPEILQTYISRQLAASTRERAHGGNRPM
ncbi:Mitochondrial 37S ribosomal protein rsm18 [Lachnellula arida]|uniref:Small ribosomal subunit protein bS18m n=1 Tax=Lachnellula arida TaxID=1316785 RepID=A0A8T9BBY9_9HELO|nr:Mitochondrial 37S ribosomal protein rsm18 [Lachnellula arida]